LFVPSSTTLPFGHSDFVPPPHAASSIASGNDIDDHVRKNPTTAFIRPIKAQRLERYQRFAAGNRRALGSRSSETGSFFSAASRPFS
jgi:hypothetical protein